jgi:hypothetical protein
MKKIRIALIVALLAALVLAPAALAQVSADYALGWNLISGGGGLSTGTNYRITGSIGQPVTGVAQSGAFRLETGYWFRASLPPLPQQFIYLPCVTR